MTEDHDDLYFDIAALCVDLPPERVIANLMYALATECAMHYDEYDDYKLCLILKETIRKDRAMLKEEGFSRD